MSTAGIISCISAKIQSLTSTSQQLLPPPVREDLDGLQETFEAIQLKISSAEVRSIRGDGGVRLWLNGLKRPVYDAEDVVDEYAYEVAQARVHGAHLINHLEELAAKLKDVHGRFIQIRKHSTRLNLVADIGGSENFKMRRIHSDRMSLEVPVTSPISDEPSIFGRAQDKEEIIELLLSRDQNGSDVVAILAMVGPEGLGKTTLARLVYDDAQIRRRFECRAWVNLSEEFCINTTTRNVLESLLRKRPILMNFDNIRRKLVKELTGKSFFIVIDGLWDLQKSQWEKFLEPFQYAQSGIIVITTQNSSVAEMVTTLPTFYVAYLPKSDCWSIFKNIAFQNLDVNNHINMLETGQKIVERREQGPLAVKAIASALKFESSEKKWENILNSRRWNGFVDVAYECMSIEMQQCFLFLTLYPKGYVFSKDEVIRLWLSVGLLEEKNSESLDVGSFFFNELIQRSMIQPCHGEGDNGVFLMHNLMHEFGQSFAGEDFIIAKSNSLDKVPLHVRYLFLITSNMLEPFDLAPLSNYPNLRVLQVMNKANQYDVPQIKVPNELFNYLPSLRSLILRDNQLEELPDSIGNLKLLRYLDLTNTCIESLPGSIGNLYNLQVLELTNCPLKELPGGIKNLVNLQILNFQNSFCLCMPNGINQLTSLRTFPRIDARSDSWHCKLSELKGLVNIRGELYIGGLGCLTSVREAEETDLRSKRNLESLTLDWSSEPSPGCSHMQDVGRISEVINNEKNAISAPELDGLVLESLRPHTNLRELHIYQYVGSKLPTWLGSESFVKLVNVSLVGGGLSCCSVLRLLLGGLPSLKNLSVQSFPRVKHVRHGLCIGAAATKGFQSLEMLEFADMPEWSNWSGVQNGEFGAHIIRLVDCPVLDAIPAPLCSFLTSLIMKDCGKLYLLPRCPLLISLAVSGNVSAVLLFYLDLPLLRSLRICHSSIRSLHLETAKLPSLKKLIIKGCRRLEPFTGIGDLRSLETLTVFSCEKLQLSVTEQLPSTLRYLSISNCPKLQEWKKCRENKYNTQVTLCIINYRVI